jgi:hypothetical protein
LEPPVERADLPTEREDLRPREVEPRLRHVTPPQRTMVGEFGWLAGWCAVS